LGPIDVLAVGRSGDRIEAFAIVPPHQGTDEFKLARYDGVRWRVLRDLCSLPSCDLRFRAALVRLGSGEAIAMPRKWRTLLHYQQGSITEAAVPSLGFAYALAHVPGFGTLIGTEHGEILRFDGEWEVVSDLGSIEIQAITGYADGLLIGGSSGKLTQLIPSGPTCPIESLLANSVVRFVRFGAAQIAIGEPSDQNSVLPLTIIHAE
jgi:hypothetical protein